MNDHQNPKGPEHTPAGDAVSATDASNTETADAGANADRVRCALYAREFTPGQDEQETIPAQLAQLRAYVSQAGWAIADTYADEGVGPRWIEGRPAFQRLLGDARRQRFDLVLVLSFDSLTRPSSCTDVDAVYDTFRDCGVKLATPNQLIDLEDDELRFKAAIAVEFDRYVRLKRRPCTTQLVGSENNEQSLLAGISREFARYEEAKIRTRHRLRRLF